ncbi:MAG: hypothetical protein DWQ11_18760 [Proteobacteria bacterium]|nr:MAG: hypothetical protein DWQ11_18760 [Pseudomonadota bacterium]
MDQTPALTHQQAYDLMAGMPTPEAVRRMEDMLLQLPQIDLQTSALVHGGMAARTIMIPAGTVLTGAQTNIDNLCVLFGDITVTTDAGPQRLTGFHVLPAAKGFKRAGVAHADTWWVTIHRTDLTDPEAIEREMTDEADRLQTNTLRLAQRTSEAIE